MPELDAEDLKLVTLARGAQLRSWAPHTAQPEGAAVRDTDGRTYSAGTVENADPGLTTTALRGAVVAAASSGARSFEAAVVVVEQSRTLDTDSGVHVREQDLAILREFGSDVPVIVVDPNGNVHEVVRT
jgi:cytidine deaminase